MTMVSERWRLGVGLALVGLFKLWLAASLGVMADEAYHWVWGQHPAFGYFDQPPLIAWFLAGVEIGSAPIILRAGPILFALTGIVALVSQSSDRALAVVWCCGLPPLFWMTQLAVPDTLLIGGWAWALAGALAGGPGLLVAGVGAGLAGLAKPTAWGLLPLIGLALSATERRSAWFWSGVAANVALLVPFLAWLLAHDGVTLAFQLTENLQSPHPPGLLGLARQLGEQAAFATPFAWMAAVAFALRWPSTRAARLAWATSVPVGVAFAVAAVAGPPEAHWPAPAYLGAGVGLAAMTGWRHRLAWLGALTGAAGSILIATHALTPLVPSSTFAIDPATRFTEGELLATRVARWALPEGAADGTQGAHAPIYTERYQEAALVHYHTGIRATVLPGCGRRTQYDLWRPQPLRPGFFVRPARSGAPRCTACCFASVVEVQSIVEVDDQGRSVGPWDLWRVTP